MELPFEKTVCHYWKQKFYKLHEQEQTQELRLPEGMPNVGRVISTWGQMILRGKEWSDRSIGISGGVMVWVLYQPEDGGEPLKLESWIPFQSRVDMPESKMDGTIRVECVLRGMDARISSVRKLVVRCSVGLLVQALVPESLEMFVPSQLPEDLEILRDSYPLTLIKEAGEKSFALDELLERTVGMDIKELIYYRLDPQLLEQKVLGSKAVFRGVGALHLLYRNGDGRLACTDFEIPFAQYVELDDEYEPDAQISSVLCLTGLELDREEDGCLHLRCGIVSQYCVQARAVFDYVEDAYSLCRDVELSVCEARISALLDSQSRTLELSQRIGTDGEAVLDACFHSGAPMIRKTESGTSVAMEGTFGCLLAGSEGLQGKNGKASAETAWQAHCTTDTVCFSRNKGCVTVTRDGADWRAQTQVVLDLSSICDQSLRSVQALKLGAERAPEPEAPSVIIRAKGEQERLWDLAKRCGSTVAAIEEMNQLDSEPDSNRLLLIPVL